MPANATEAASAAVSSLVFIVDVSRGWGKSRPPAPGEDGTEVARKTGTRTVTQARAPRMQRDREDSGSAWNPARGSVRARRRAARMRRRATTEVLLQQRRQRGP